MTSVEGDVYILVYNQNGANLKVTPIDVSNAKITPEENCVVVKKQIDSAISFRYK